MQSSFQPPVDCESRFLEALCDRLRHVTHGGLAAFVEGPGFPLSYVEFREFWLQLQATCGGDTGLFEA